MRTWLRRVQRALAGLPLKTRLILTQPWRDHVLRRHIRGKRVLIVGSGPSAGRLPPIPDDMLVFACNLSPAFLPARNGVRHVDLYMLSRNAYLDYRDKITPLIKTLAVDVIVTPNRRFISSLPFSSYRRVLYERFIGSKKNYGFKRLTGEAMPAALQKTAARNTPSSGIGLLLYALLYGAREVYIAGMDLGDKATPLSNWERTKGGVHPHKSIDEAVLQVVAGRYDNVCCAVPDTPLTRLFPHKELV